MRITHTLHHFTKQAVLGVVAFLGAASLSIGVANAQQMVSIKADTVNMRAAPRLGSDVLWQLGSGYPLKVVARKGNWLQVVDFENDKGWVSKRLTTSAAPRFIVKSPRANLRAGPGTRHKVLATASYGDVFRTLEKRKSWVRVKGEDGRKGWIARRLLWGW